MKHIDYAQMSPYRYPFYILFHPFDGFQEMRYNKKGSMRAALVIVFCWLLVELFHRSFTSFDMNNFDKENILVWRVSLITVLMYVLACLSNWCFCTLLDGKGRLKDIMIVGAYSLLPYILIRFATVILSWVLVLEEQMLLTYLVVLSEIWSGFMVIVGLQEIHEYSLKKTLLSLLLTVVGIVIMLFLALTVVMLFQQLYLFVTTVIFELRY